MFGLAFEPLSKRFVLGGDAERAGIFVAHAHHHASHGYERGRRKAEFLRTEERRDGDVPAAHEFAVGLQDHMVTQPVFDQGFVRLGKAELPGKSRVMDR